MKGAVLEGVRTIKLKEVPDPSPGQHEVSVRVRACGICQTDNLAYTGARSGVKFPTILGHEMSGVVEEVGAGVGIVSPGDAVVVSPVIACGRCRFCRLGLANHCENGIVIGGEGQPVVMDGGFAEFVQVPEAVLYLKPSTLSFEAAALTEPLAGSYKGLIEYSNLRIGEDVVIIGSGSMGLLLAMVGMAAGAGRLVVVDRVSERLQVASRVGVRHIVDASVEDPVKRVREIMPEGPDVVVEAAGTLEAASLAFKLAGRACRVNMFGVIVPGEIGVSPKQIHFSEVRVDASFSITPRAMTKSLQLMERGLVDPSRIITHRYRLEEIQAAFDSMERRDRVKVMIVQ